MQVPTARLHRRPAVRHNEKRGTRPKTQTPKDLEIVENVSMLLNRTTSSTSTSETSLITHRGPWDAHSRQYKSLRFLERYLDTLDESKLKSTPCTTFFSPNAVFHDTKGDVYLSGSHIWAWMKRLFAPFESVTHEIVEVRVIPETEDRVVVYGEFVRHFRMRGDKTDIVSPMFCIVTIGPAECEGGTDGLQIYEASVFWDTGILSRYAKRRDEEQKERR